MGFLGRTRLDIVEDRIETLERQIRQLSTDVADLDRRSNISGVGYPQPSRLLFPGQEMPRSVSVREAVTLIMKHLGITFEHVKENERLEIVPSKGKTP